MMKNRLLYVHIPKCGGMSVRHVTGMPDGFSVAQTHVTLETWQKLLGGKIDNYYVITVVRDPISRFYSAWNYLRLQNPSHIFYWSDTAERLAVIDHSTPISFLEENRYTMKSFPRFAPQVMWLGNGIDEMIKFEELAERWPAIADRFGYAAELPHMNNTTYIKPENQRVEQLIRSIYENDFAYCNY